MHEVHEDTEQIRNIMRTGTRLRMSLESKSRPIDVADALHGAVEQRAVREFQRRRKRVLVDGKAVVLAADQHPSGREFLHRVVGTVMTGLHLHRARTAGKPQQLAAQADAEHRNSGFQQLCNGCDCVLARLGIARSVRQEYPVRTHRDDLGCRCRRRHHGDRAAAMAQQAKDVALDAEVVGNHPELPGSTRAFPYPLVPFIGGIGGHLAREIAPCQGAEGTRERERLGCVHLVRQATGLGTLRTQDMRQPSGVDAFDTGPAPGLQKISQGHGAAPVAHASCGIAHDETRGMYGRGLVILGVGADVADVRVRQRDQLGMIRRVGEDFLVATDRSIEDDFARGGAGRSEGISKKKRTILQSE